MEFYIGLPLPYYARLFESSFISINRLRRRTRSFTVKRWILDSGAFSEIWRHGHYRHSPEQYAHEVNRWSTNGFGEMVAAVSQDYMCEPELLRKSGLRVEDHQRLTIERYCAIKRILDEGVYLMPVIQGYSVDEYVRHVLQYDDLLAPNAYVGVGSVCKRSNSPQTILSILSSIHEVRPDLRLHGFGLKITSLECKEVVDHLHSSDSMAWSWSAHKNGRDRNDVTEAQWYVRRVNEILEGHRRSEQD